MFGINCEKHSPWKLQHKLNTHHLIQHICPMPNCYFCPKTQPVTNRLMAEQFLAHLWPYGRHSVIWRMRNDGAVVCMYLCLCLRDSPPTFPLPELCSEFGPCPREGQITYRSMPSSSTLGGDVPRFSRLMRPSFRWTYYVS